MADQLSGITPGTTVAFVDIPRLAHPWSEATPEVSAQARRLIGDRLATAMNLVRHRFEGHSLMLLEIPGQTELADAVSMAEQIVRLVAEPVPGFEQPLVAHVGFTLTKTDGSNESEVLREADGAMYLARNAREPWVVMTGYDDHGRWRIESTWSSRITE
jgi:GGDEF domain-containing protein